MTGAPTLTGRRRRRRGPAQAEAARTLCALVRCGRLVVAIPADTVSRIVLREEAAATVDGSGRLQVRSGVVAAPGWELGRLLGVEAETSAWLFLKVHGDTVMALGCGQCLTMQRLIDPAPLPRGLFRAGGDAIIGAFPVDEALVASGCGFLGIWIDPVRLIGGGAIAAAAAGAEA